MAFKVSIYNINNMKGGKIIKLYEKFKQMLKVEKNNDFSQQNDPDNSCEDLSKQNQVTVLTPREYDLYLLLLEGFTLKECAKQLSIKYSTANTHMTSIYKKLGVNSRAELIINYRSIEK